MIPFLLKSVCDFQPWEWSQVIDLQRWASGVWWHLGLYSRAELPSKGTWSSRRLEQAVTSQLIKAVPVGDCDTVSTAASAWRAHVLLRLTAVAVRRTAGTAVEDRCF